MSGMLDVDAIRSAVDDFFVCVGSGEVEFYNEFSLQHEIGIHLRAALGGRFKVQFERPTDYFDISGRTEKREIDISVFSEDKLTKAALELKFPRSGQYPEQMFSACRDLAFLEDLVRAGFAFGLFVMCVEDALFCRGAANGPLYGAFRAGSVLTGVIRKPTGARDRSVELNGAYRIEWQAAGDVRYAVVPVDPVSVGGQELGSERA